MRALKVVAPKEADVQSAVIRALVARRLGLYLDLRQAKTPAARAMLIGRVTEEAARMRSSGVPVVVFWRNNAGAIVVPASEGRQRRSLAYGLPGSADLTGIIYGRADGESGARFELEIKRPGGRLEEHQRAYGLMIQGAGGYYAHAHSVEEACGLVASLLGRREVTL